MGSLPPDAGSRATRQQLVGFTKFEFGGFVIVKKILAGVAALVATVVLTACSSGASGGSMSLAAANGSPTTFKGRQARSAGWVPVSVRGRPSAARSVSHRLGR
jgi:hypothetical protein